MKPTNRISYAVTRLVLSVSFALTVLYSLLILLYSWTIEDNIFNRLVVGESTFIKEHFDKTGTVAAPKAGFISMHRNWQGVPKEIVESYALDHEKVEHNLSSGKTYHLQVIDLGGISYVLLADVHAFEVSRDYFPNVVLVLIALSLLCCLVVVLLGLRMAKLITSPINTLTLAVDKAKQAQIRTGFSMKFPDNEVRSLAQVIEDSVGHLQQALSRETNFTKDVSHEMRTPIAIIKSLLERMSDTRRFTVEDFQKLLRATTHLEQTTETLLALAREESNITQQTNLTELIENCVLQHFELNHSEKGKKLNVTLALHHDVTVWVNQELTRILINNLLSNMVSYCHGEDIKISLNSTHLIFENKYLHALPMQPLLSGQKSSSSVGIGQGLSLIQRICDTNDWQLSVATDEKMFITTIDLTTERQQNHDS